jgi:16S rRNA (guanine966-N2)-methyltransferase
MFNSVGSEIQGARVLDAFAGTGALGFEALSRGAASVDFIERDRVAANVLRENYQSLGSPAGVDIITTTVSNWLDTTADREYDIIFCDPPYHDEQLSTVSRLLGLLKPNALMILSSTGRGEVPIHQDDIVVVDNRSYGTANLTSFRRRSA